MKEYEITGLEDYNNHIIELVKEGFCFFRGDKIVDRNEENLLLTSFDKKKDGEFIYNKNDSDNMINDFMSVALSRLSYIPTNYFETMLTAQHYGIPTRLQDWSESPLVSLFFSTSNSKDLGAEDKCIIWCLNPIKLNSYTKRVVQEITNEPYVPNISLSSQNEDSSIGYIMDYYGPKDNNKEGLYPIAISTYKINPRIEAQKGVFLIYPRSRKSLIEFEHVEEYLVKLIISRDVAIELENVLQIYKINNFQMFPEIGSIAKDVIKKYER